MWHYTQNVLNTSRRKQKVQQWNVSHTLLSWLLSSLSTMSACVCPSLAQVPSVACAGVGPVQPGDPVSWSVWWLPVRVPGTWCRPEVQEGQTHRPQYVCLPEHMSVESSVRRCVLLTLSSPVPVPPDDPVIDGGPEVLLNAGESYNLSCVSRGAKPPSMIEWLKDGLPVEGAASTTVSGK